MGSLEYLVLTPLALGCAEKKPCEIKWKVRRTIPKWLLTPSPLPHSCLRSFIPALDLLQTCAAHPGSFLWNLLDPASFSLTLPTSLDLPFLNTLTHGAAQHSSNGIESVCWLAHVNFLLNKIEVGGSLCSQALMQQDAAYFSLNNQ